ncbi:MAG: M28 family peptidase [Planctomycetaceae bacterium]
MFRTLLACAVLASPLAAEELSPGAQRLLNDVKYLASDELEGRGVGTEGLEKAAAYVADVFQRAGLDVTRAGGDPFQEFEVTDGAQLTEPNLLSFIGPDGKQIDLALDADFRTCSFGAAGKIDAPIVFVGYGIEDKELEFDEYAGVDVKDKVVLIVRRTPLQGNADSAFTSGHGISRHAALSTKVSHAFSRGAAAVIFVNDHFTGLSERQELEEQRDAAREKLLASVENVISVGDSNGDLPPALQRLKDDSTHLKQVEELLKDHSADVLMEFGYGGTRSGRSFPIFHITQKYCDALLQPAIGKTLQDLENEIDNKAAPASQELKGWRATGQASLEVIKRPVKNVIGVLEGKGDLADETVVIGAHVDHLGYGGEGSFLPNVHEIHNGADDNASGTAGLLELARRLGKLQERRRRLVFIAFTGEERGLLGSAEYVKNPVFPLESTVAMLNMDMIGRLADEEKLTVFGTGTSSVWENEVDSLSSDLGLEIIKKPEGFGPSDHSSFYAKKIPVLHFFTGIHTDYHRPSDDWQNINAAGMDQIVTLVERIAIETLNAPQRPDYIEIAGQAQLQRSGSRPYFGSIPDFSTEAEGYAISGVAAGSPAEKGGLKAGDVIVRFGENRVGGLDDFDLALRKFKPGQQVTVVVLRDGEEVPLKVTLATPKG